MWGQIQGLMVSAGTNILAERNWLPSASCLAVTVIDSSATTDMHGWCMFL